MIEKDIQKKLKEWNIQLSKMVLKQQTLNESVEKPEKYNQKVTFLADKIVLEKLEQFFAVYVEDQNVSRGMIIRLAMKNFLNDLLEQTKTTGIAI